MFVYFSDSVSSSAQKAAKSLDGLDILVKDLLTLSQMETGDIKMNPAKIDVKQITKEVFEQL